MNKLTKIITLLGNIQPVLEGLRKMQDRPGIAEAVARYEAMVASLENCEIPSGAELPRIRQAVCILLRDTRGNVMTVTRPGKPTVGFPGGKVEPGESATLAAMRELREETGITVLPQNLHPIYAGLVVGTDGNHFFCTTFVAETLYDYADEFVGKRWIVEGDLSVGFDRREDLTGDRGAFPEYNSAVVKEEGRWHKVAVGLPPTPVITLELPQEAIVS